MAGTVNDVPDVPRPVLAPGSTHLPRAMGRLEGRRDTTTRVVGTTSDPVLVVERLVVLPVSYRIVGGPEVRTAALQIAARLSDASSQ